MADLDKWFRQQKTAPQLRRAVVASLDCWQSGAPIPDTRSSKLPGLRAALTGQTALGWYNFLVGRIHVKFEAVQQRYYKRIKSKLRASTWMKGLIRQLWDIIFDLWQHRNGIAHSEDHPWKIADIEHLQDEIRH